MKKLPENFAILSNQKHPLWKKYIDWINKTYERGLIGDQRDCFYGATTSGIFCEKIAPSKTELITIEYWAECVGLSEEKKIIGYLAPFDMAGGKIKKGHLFVKCYDNNLYRSHDCKQSMVIPKEIVESWEAVHDNSETVEIADLTFLLKQDKVFLNDQDITEQLKKLLDAVK